MTGAVIVLLYGAWFTWSCPYALYFAHLPRGKWLTAAIGWLVATAGPILIGIILWRLATTWRVPWLVHLLLLPGLYAALVVGEWMMLTTQYVPDFDSTMGAPILPALLSAMATITIYAAALVLELSSRRGA